MQKEDIYTRVTAQIIEAIEKGALDFRMPWHTGLVSVGAPMNARSKRFYRGVNAVTLWASAEVRGYPTGTWATYQQWKDLGAQVRSGEKATSVVFWKTCNSKKDKDAGTDDETDEYLVARGFTVFNAAQVDGYSADAFPRLSEENRIQSAEEFFARLRLDVRYGGSRAFYSSLEDYVQMPEFARFREPSSFYSTLGHEAVHWTGAPSRLDRQLGMRFGKEAYAAEELVAELGAAFLAARIGSFAKARSSHAGYVARWLELLKNDKRAIFTAASKAQQAVDWLIEQSGGLSIAA